MHIHVHTCTHIHTQRHRYTQTHTDTAHTCTHTYMCMHAHTQRHTTYTHVHTCTHAYTHIHTCAHTCTHRETHSIYTCTHMHMHTTYAHMHTHMHTCTYTHTHTHTHTHTCLMVDRAPNRRLTRYSSPQPFGTGDQFHGRQFFHRQLWGLFGDDSSTLHLLCTLFPRYCISSTSDPQCGKVNKMVPARLSYRTLPCSLTSCL